MKRVLVDLDGVVADFNGYMAILAPDLFLGEGEGYDLRSAMLDQLCLDNPNTFQNFEPIEGAVQAVKKLMDHYECFFLSTPMWNVPDTYSDKRIWVGKHFGDHAKKKLILSHRKDIVMGDYLIDDRIMHGVDDFTGEHIHFGTEKFPDWDSVLEYLL